MFNGGGVWLIRIIPGRIRKMPVLSSMMSTPKSEHSMQPLSRTSKEGDEIAFNREDIELDIIKKVRNQELNHLDAISVEQPAVHSSERKLGFADLVWAIVIGRRYIRGDIARVVRENEDIVKERIERVGGSMLGLNSMELVETFKAHEILVRHMQFSPDGKFLATCR